MKPISMQTMSINITKFSIAIALASMLFACSKGEPIALERYQPVDELFETISSNLGSFPSLKKVADIDHSRLAAATESFMPPARVLIFSDAALESNLLQQNQLIGVDLPLRMLAYEDTQGSPKVIHNDYDYLVSRYELTENSAVRAAHNRAYAQALVGIEHSDRSAFDNNPMQPDGLITIDSPFDFATTVSRVNEAINSQDDTSVFGEVDFQANASELGVDLRPTTLILFGAPAPGGKAMQEAITLGLDAFCQKFLIWEDEQGGVHLTYNDLLDLAERQNVPKSIALRVINFRLSRTFKAALAK